MISSILDPELNDCTGLEIIACMNPSTTAEHLVDGLLDMGCKVYPATSPEDALNKLQCHAFNIVILEENYSIEVMQLLACLPMTIRRNVFYILVGNSFETGNMMQSYVLSANLVVNIENIAYFAKILTEAILDNNRFFRPLYYTLQVASRQES